MKTLTLDELLHDLAIGKVDWIKIDVEGAEMKVLKGGESLLKNTVNLNIIIESDSNQAALYLRKYGFQTKHLGEIYYLATKNTK